MTTLLIDNYDSFTFNLFQYLSELGANVVVHRNDAITLADAIALHPKNIVISPGPGTPADSGVSRALIKHFAGKIPILGVCLGHQAIVEVFGGTVTVANEIVHGKVSPIAHDGKGIYQDVPNSFLATRYHSLAAVPNSIPPCLTVTATCPARAGARDSQIIQGVRHIQFTVEGVQFHPESITSEHGHQLLKNFLDLKSGVWN